MKKRYIFAILSAFVVVFFFISLIYSSEKFTNTKFNIDELRPRYGQNLWVYNMNNRSWRGYLKSDDEESKETVILKLLLPENNSTTTLYGIRTSNSQVVKENLCIGDSSYEFLYNNKLYSYFPKTFEYYEIVFNGIKFVPSLMKSSNVEDLFKGYNIVKVSDLKKNKVSFKYSRYRNKFIVLNDIGEDFYQYYIIPNNSKIMQLEEFSNQFKVTGSVDVKIQRLEGCSKAYPCYEISIK